MTGSALGTFHHVGMAVPSIARAAKGLCAVLHARLESDVIHDPHQGVRIQFVSAGGLRIELLEPAATPSPIDGILKRGIGLYHLGYEVDDLEKKLSECASMGMKVVSPPKPAAAFDHRRVAFVMHQGMMIELIERAEAAA